jgi:DNA-directed RNA polymerase subunit K/omega
MDIAESSDDAAAPPPPPAGAAVNWGILSKYERTMVIGWRAEMLARGSPPLLDLDPDQAPDPVTIAKLELLANKLGFLKIQRTMPDGTKIAVPLTSLALATPLDMSSPASTSSVDVVVPAPKQ